MIALTQEKREELVERYSQQIETFKYHLSQIGTDHFDGEAYSEILLKTEIALASLTAEPVLHAVDSDVEDKMYTALCNEHEDGSYPLFIAPPVPEIKLPEYKRNGKPLNILAELVWAECIDEIKRLNGLGE